MITSYTGYDHSAHCHEISSRLSMQRLQNDRYLPARPLSDESWVNWWGVLDMLTGWWEPGEGASRLQSYSSAHSKARVWSLAENRRILREQRATQR